MSKNRREVTAEELMTKRTWQGRSLHDRLQHLASIVVPHPQFSHALQEIERRRRRVIAQSKGAALCIVAATGGGKTTLARKIRSLYPDVETDELSIRRVVYFSVPPRPSSRAMSSAVLQALKDPYWDRGRADVLERRTIHLLNQCMAEVILIDNVHDIPERRTIKGVREVGNWVRNIIDGVPSLLVSLGAEQGLNVFKANSQARRRSPAVIQMDYFNCLVEGGVPRFRRFLFELDIQLPLSQMSNLADFDIAKRMWIATNGIPDYIVGLITEAIELAYKKQREMITLDDLEKAFDALFEDARSALNPFSASALNLRSLDQEGEPFEDWLSDGYV